MNIRKIGEKGLIERFRKKIHLDNSVVKGPGDDAAVIKWKKDKFLLFTCDMIIEDTHFTKRTATPREIGHKALAVNISDIAAMGGIPRQAVVSLGLPGNTTLSFVDGIFSGIKTLADKFGVNITGGDVNASNKLIINIALIGEVEKNKLLTRSGAKSGDAIMVTGRLGGSSRGKHLRFTPRVKEARYLARNFRINSMIDISDGLSGDLNQICRASKVGAVIYESLIPVSREARSVKNALSDGEDFELLFTVPKRSACKIVARFKKRPYCNISIIGTIAAASGGVNIITRFGKSSPLSPAGFRHF